MKKYLFVIISCLLMMCGYVVYRQHAHVNPVYQVIEICDGDEFFDVGNVETVPEILVSKVVQEHVVAEQPAAMIPAEHGFNPLSKSIFTTSQERQQFFDEQGIEYCNYTHIAYTPLLEQDAKLSEEYLADVEENELLTQAYGHDIAMQNLIPISIRWLGADIGHGVFAEQDVPKWGFIGIYGGVVQDRQFVDNKDYAWAYPAQTIDGGKITLDALKKGNELRLINDGKDPNCIVKYILGHDELWHVCYLAAHNIKKGDQLLVSYGPAYWDTRKYAYQQLADVQ